ncbi:MAG: sugar phosphate isomerase/epimerase family protein [Sedimentisphaeraceae bacterium JB056]
MIRPGLVSISFRQLDTKQVIEMVKTAGLSGIEWGGDVHVPHGNLEVAREVADQTKEAGLDVAAYGSYFRVGVSEDEGLKFKDVLETALTLGTDKIRVWAGNKDSEDADADFRGKIISESKEIAKMAADKGVTMVYEFHGGTLTNTYESAVELLESIDDPNFQSYWQPINGAGVKINSEGIDKLKPWIRGIHCFHWWPDHTVRLPLAQGWDDWKCYLEKLSKIDLDMYSLMEFVVDDDPENFKKDAEVLKTWLAEFN